MIFQTMTMHAAVYACFLENSERAIAQSTTNVSACEFEGPWVEPNPWSWSITFSAAQNWIASW